MVMCDGVVHMIQFHSIYYSKHTASQLVHHYIFYNKAHHYTGPLFLIYALYKGLPVFEYGYHLSYDMVLQRYGV